MTDQPQSYWVDHIFSQSWMDFVCSLIRPDLANHWISATIPNHSLANFVIMVPHMPTIGHQEPSEQIFLVEKPGFDIAVITGIKDELKGEPELVIL